jgi:hypothetical protein
MTRYDGIEVEDFDPNDPHCFMCEQHLDEELPVVILMLVHQVTGERKAVVSCLGCAIKDPAVASIIRDHRTHEHKDYLN